MPMPEPLGESASLEAKVALLRRPETWPERPAQIEERETHMSWVFLTPDHAYKLKKPVRYDFLDFSTLERRRRDSEVEVQLNRRLAPGVYMGVVPLAVDASGRGRIEGEGKAIEWLVKMRRLPEDRMLDQCIRRGELREGQLRELAHLLARFYRDCPAAGLDRAQYRAAISEAIEINRRELAVVDHQLPRDTVRQLHAIQTRFLQNEAELFDARVDANRIVEGHGDLRPEHVCLETPPLIIDCLEFNRGFRLIDPADELSFLAMECERLGAPRAGWELFEGYGEESGDRPPERLLWFYRLYRACLRARLAIWHTRELDEGDWPRWQERARVYLHLARDYAARLTGDQA